MNDEKERLARFLFHLGKGLWKSVPVIGPIIDEIVYERLKTELIAKVESLPSSEMQLLFDKLSKFDVEALNKKLDDVSIETQSIYLASYVRILNEISTGYESINKKLSLIDDNTSSIPNIVSILKSMRSSLDRRQPLEKLIENIEGKRQAWIHRLSRNQCRVLAAIPHDPIHIDDIWEIIRVLIHDCGYKEFRFRLHELEWLGLINRYRNSENNAWYYQLSVEGEKQIAKEQG